MASPTPAIREQLTSALGPKSGYYWSTLKSFLSAKIARVEFEELIREVINTPNLVQLHNSLLISVISSSVHHAPPTPPPEAPGLGKPPRKRRRTLPYQGPPTNNEDFADGDDGSLRSTKFKRWTVGVGRRERERIRKLDSIATSTTAERKPRAKLDEIAQERGVPFVNDTGPLASFPPVQLASVTRAPTFQHINERLALISAQHNLPSPHSKQVASLMMLAYEAKLKQLISQALVLTSTSQTITSIQLANPPSSSASRVLSASSFETLLTVRPAALPYDSAAATRLLSETKPLFDHEKQFKERHTSDPRWQYLAILAERSTVRSELLASRS